jgi:hypothetical protein
MQIADSLFFHTPASPDAQNRSRWKSKKPAGNLKDLLENKISSGTRNIPPEISKFRRKIKKSPGK